MELWDFSPIILLHVILKDHNLLRLRCALLRPLQYHKEETMVLSSHWVVAAADAGNPAAEDAGNPVAAPESAVNHAADAAAAVK